MDEQNLSRCGPRPQGHQCSFEVKNPGNKTASISLSGVVHLVVLKAGGNGVSRGGFGRRDGVWKGSSLTIYDEQLTNSGFPSQSAQLAGFLELNAQLVELHHKRLTEAGHNPSGQYQKCPVNPVVRDAQGFPNHLPCPCENEDIDDLEGKAGPTLVTCPPGLLLNLKRELEKFSNLKVIMAGSDYPSPWSTLVRKSGREPIDMCRDIVLISSAQVFSQHCLANPTVSSMVKLSRPERQKAELDYGWLKSLGFSLDGCKDSLFGTDFKSRRKFNVSFARVVMDEAHNIRNKSSKTFGWLKYLSVPVWLVSGSAGCMSPIQWDGWRGLLERKEWKTHPVAGCHTNNRFYQLRTQFTAAAKATPIEPDPEDSDDGAVRAQRYNFQKILEEWGNMLRAVMIRRCATDRLWGQDLMPLPEGAVEVIDFPLQQQGKRISEAYLAFQSREKDEVSGGGAKSDKSTVGSEPLGGQRPGDRGQVKVYLKCRVASTLPGVCLLPGLAAMTFLKQWVEEIARQDQDARKQPSLIKSNLQFIINSSPKLLWLQRFLRQLGTDYLGRPEKLLIFSSSPMILYCVDLVSTRSQRAKLRG